MNKNKNNPFDPDMFKNIQQMMNTITNVQQTQPNLPFDFGGIKNSERVLIPFLNSSSSFSKCFAMVS